MARRPRAEFEITAEDRARATLRGVDRSLTNLSRTAALGTRALGGIAGAVGLSEIASLADRYNALSIRIRTATRETGDFNQVQRDLINLSIQTGTELATTVDTFQAFSRIREDIGATNTQVIALSQAVQQLGVIGGSSTQDLQFGLRQFNQAIAAGVFRAEEFNSIVENLPELAARIADGFGLTQGQLRQLVLDGQLFADDVVNTLLRQAPEIAAQFEEIPTTLERAFSSLKTAIGTAAAGLDQAFGVTSGLGKAIQTLAEELTVQSGSGSPAQLLGRQIEALGEEEARLRKALQRVLAGRGLNEIGEGTRKILDGIKDELDVVIARTATAEAELARLAPAGAGQVTGGDRTGGADVDEAKLAGLAQKGFNAALSAEQDFLDRQRELRLRGQEELATAISNEEERLNADRLARALGFEDQRSQLLFEKEEELFLARLEGRELRFEEELAQELGFEDRRQQLLVEQEQLLQQKLAEARFKGNDLAIAAARDLAKFEKANAVGRARTALDIAQRVTAGLATESKTLFQINKAAGIANAVINTAQGVTKALSLGPSGIPLAALIAALGAAEIATIAGTQFGGGSSGNTSFGAGSGIPSQAGDSVLRDIPVVTSDSANRVQIDLTVGGVDEMTDVLAANLTARVREGDEVLVTTRSRNALDLGDGL